MRTFEYTDARSHKFWNIEVSDKSFTVTFGKIGTAGQTQTKSFASAAKAEAEADKLIGEKLKKGYVETTPKAASSQAEAFDRALAADPHDLAGWSAYADYLTERGDPRGEFMAVQIALEHETRSREGRKKLHEREKKLLEQHERNWLGNLTTHLLDRVEATQFQEFPKPVYSWQRGFLATLTVQYLTTAFAQALATDPAARFIREFRVHETAVNYGAEEEEEIPFRVRTPPGVDRHWELLELIRSPFLENLRVLQVGGEVPAEDGWCDCHFYASGIEHVVAAMPHVEELYLYCKGYAIDRLFALKNLTHLRVLLVYHLGERGNRRGGSGYEYPLDVLAENRALGNLTHLLFHPHNEESYTDPLPSFLPLDQIRSILQSKHLTSLTHLQLRLSDMGDEGVQEIVASGILKRLKSLDLRHGCITDEGAALFAACSDTKNLERLELSRNAVSSAGLRALRKAGVGAVANNPLTEQELADQQYLREGDFE